MQHYSSAINFPEGIPLGGYGDRVSQRTRKPGRLEINGLSVTTENDKWEICGIDALYPGFLNSEKNKNGGQIFAASHTHYAPMLDKSKPSLGVVVDECIEKYSEAFLGARREAVVPDLCTLYSAEVSIPVYRRFDYPNNVANRFLSRFGGAYPNEKHPVDRSLRIFVFSEKNRPIFAIVYHACHPVSRFEQNEISADFINSVREGVRKRFEIETCLFFQGCAGDIRPNIAKKRVSWLPKNRLNWRFNYEPDQEAERVIDCVYADAVAQAVRKGSVVLEDQSFKIRKRKIHIEGYGATNIPGFHIDDLVSFYFFPFEVSHRYHLDLMRESRESLRLIVSCSGDTKGYLPHPSQLACSGYEVDDSRDVMNLSDRVSFDVRQLL